MNNFIKVICYTNLDKYHNDAWPEWMINPKPGDKVQSNTGTILRICDITHLFDNQSLSAMAPQKAILRIELYEN